MPLNMKCEWVHRRLSQLALESVWGGGRRADVVI